LAVTISVLDVVSPRVYGRSASDLVHEFAASVASDPLRLKIVAPPERGQERAFARFDSAEFALFAGMLRFSGGVVLASATCAFGDAAGIAEGERLVASIAPLSKRRRWLRR
jgi:hypothetical protein